MITIDNISCYLPYGLKFISDMDKPYHEYGKQRAHICNGIIELFGDDCLNSKEFNDAYAVGRCLPILYPSLTTPITHKGETFVPLLELAKIALGNIGSHEFHNRRIEKQELIERYASPMYSNSEYRVFGYDSLNQSFYYTILEKDFGFIGSFNVKNQLLLFRNATNGK